MAKRVSEKVSKKFLNGSPATKRKGLTENGTKLMTRMISMWNSSKSISMNCLD